MPSHGLDRLELTVHARRRTPPALDVANAVGALARDAVRTRRRVGTIADAFDETVPARLAQHCTIVGLKGGTLSVRVGNAAVGYRLSQWLRSGGEAALARASIAPIKRVRITQT